MPKPDAQPETQQIRPEDVQVADRLRAVSPEHVEVLASSIAEQGLQTPIICRRDDAGQLHLICGAHRFEAAKFLELEAIPARVYEWITDQQALLIEIDENLFRHELNPFDRAASLAARKVLYEELYPETRRGVAGGKAATATLAVVGFTKATADKTGFSERTIYRAIAMYEGLDPEVRARISGTHLAAQEGELFKLSKTPPEKQRNAVALLLGKEPRATTVSAALSLLEGKPTKTVTPTEAEYRKIVDAWERASKAARKRFLTYLQKAGVKLLGGPSR